MKDLAPICRAQRTLAVGRVSASKTVLTLGTATKERILFLSPGIPTALEVGEVVYAVDSIWTSAFTRAIHEFAEKKPIIRIHPDEFDFVIGAALTRAGLPLTARAKG